MASQKSTIDFILKQIATAGSVSAKKMFGEYGIYCDEKIVALVCDDQLFVKPTTAGITYMGEYIEGEPYPGAKPYLLIPREKWDKSQWLANLIKISANELALPKKKSKKIKKY